MTSLVINILNSVQTRRIVFDSLAEDIVEDATKQLTQYHVTGPESEIWAVNDFKAASNILFS